MARCRAGRGLSGLMGQEIAIHVPNIRVGTRADACDAVGGPEAVVLGAYLSISGDITGHVMLLFPESRALRMRRPDVRADTGHDDRGRMSWPARRLANWGISSVRRLSTPSPTEMNLVLHPSPPTVVNDMAIALVQTVYADILSQGGEVVMMDAIFEDQLRAHRRPAASWRRTRCSLVRLQEVAA